MLTAQKNLSDKPLAIVIGGAGFTGSFLCELLLQNCQVICIDDFSSGKKENLENCLSTKDFTLFNLNVKKRFPDKLVSYLEQFSQRQSIYIFHLLGLDIGRNHLLELSKRIGAKFLEIAGKDENNDQLPIDTDVRTVFVDYAYGPRMDLNDKSYFIQLIRSAVLGLPLRIPKDGSEKINPTYVSDVVYGLTKAMFGTNTRGQLINLASPREVTFFEIAQELKKLSKRPLRIENIMEKSSPQAHLTKAISEKPKKFNWKPKIDIHQGLGQTLSYFENLLRKEVIIRRPIELIPLKDERIVKKDSRVHVPAVSSRNGASTGLHPKFSVKGDRKPVLQFIIPFLSIFLFFLFVFFIYPLSITLLNCYLGFKNFKMSQMAFITGDFSKSINRAIIAKEHFANSQKYASRLIFFAKTLKQTDNFDSLATTLLVGEQAADILNHLSSAGQYFFDIGKIVFQGQSGDINSLVSKTDIELASSYQLLSLIEAEIKTTKNNSPVSQLIKTSNLVKKSLEILPGLRNQVLIAKRAILLIPSFVGVNKKQTYMILLQNSNELRPTGGFIGSFGLLTFDQGKMVDLEIQDVYWADGQLKGHVEPPAEMKKHLGESNWYLRDSNWNPDFPLSAKRAAWFLEKETGRSVDGVIGVNLFLAQKIIAALGEVNLPDFKENINAQNLFERAEYYSEVGFFPGSTQKQDFLGGLTRALFEKIKSGEKTWSALAQNLWAALKSKDLLVWLNNNEAMEIISDLDWDGRIKDLTCLSSNLDCQIDYLMIVEANVGVNKANYFIKREIEQEININDRGEITETLRLYYQNDSPSETFPAGRYKNYLRILVPESAELLNVSLQGDQIDKQKVDQSTVSSKKSFGFLVEVPIKEKRLVEVAYKQTQKIDLDRPNKYLFLLQKQSGFPSVKFNLLVTPPAGTTLLPVRPNAIAKQQGYSFSPELNQDIVFEFSLIK